MRGVLDTSVLIANEQGRPLDVEQVPENSAISVVTLAELQVGVHLAAGEAVRAQRMATLNVAVALYDALPIDEQVAAAFAELVTAARRDGKRPKVQDTWIAATAKAHDAAVVTQDDDFDAFAGIDVIRV